MPQKRDLNETKKALLCAAKTLMTGCQDADEVTSRIIAAKANVNPAMINYCYGSREALLYEVFRELLEDAQRENPALAELMSADIPPAEALTLLHYNMMKMMITNFSCAKAVTRYILLNRSNDIGMESLSFIRAHFGQRKTEHACKLIAFELTSLHELAVLRHKALKADFGLDLTDDNVLAQYVRENVSRYLD